MKKISLLFGVFISLGIFTVSASFDAGNSHLKNYITAGNFLATKSVIQDHTGNEENYGLYNTITRREMLKVMMNISGKDFPTDCKGKFSDMNSSDWGCKYAEAALSYGFIAKNTSFRPNDSVTKIEALKMIMQAKGIERDDATDWREGYVSKAVTIGILDASFSDFNTKSLRGWIFETASKTYDDAPEFGEVGSEGGLTPEEQELLNHFLNI